MEIECEECGGNQWELALRRYKIGVLSHEVASVLRCKKCGMAYELSSYRGLMTIEDAKERARRYEKD